MGENHITYPREDEHFQALIAKNQRLCQTTMKVPIDRAQHTAEKAHERVDDALERLIRLDDPETGKVTTMWNDRNALTNTIRAALVLGVLIVAGSAYFGLRGGAKETFSASDVKNIVQMAVDETVKQITH